MMIDFEDRDDAGRKALLAFIEGRPFPKRKIEWLPMLLLSLVCLTLLAAHA